MSTAPVEFPPPVDSAQGVRRARPTDPEDERIEVGVAIVGGGPAGLACAIRLTQLLAEDEALMESLGEVPVALVEKGKGPGSHLLSGAMMNPSAMKKLFPDLPESEWPTYGPVAQGRRLPAAELEAGDPAQADPAALPQPRQPRDLRGAARPLAVRAGRGGGRVHPRRDRCRQAARGGRPRCRRPLRRQGPRARRRGALELRARLRPDRQGHRARRGDPGTPDRRGDPPLPASAPRTRSSGSSA